MIRRTAWGWPVACESLLVMAALEPLGPQSKLDLPPLVSNHILETSIAAGEDYTSSNNQDEKVTKIINTWGSRYLNKKWMEDRLRSGKTLPAPILSREDVQAELLFPVQGRLDNRVLPLGVLLKIGLPKKTPSKQNPPSSIGGKPD